MSVQALTEYFLQYGAWFIFFIVLLEYMNFPGFPAGVIMPLAGVWAAKGEIAFPMVLFLAVLAGVIGSSFLYALGRWGGTKLSSWYFQKFPKQQCIIEEKIRYLQKKGSIGIFVSHLIPVVRTLISIPAGMIRMNFILYIACSFFGILLWNLVLVGAGYVFGEVAIGYLV